MADDNNRYDSIAAVVQMALFRPTMYVNYGGMLVATISFYLTIRLCMGD